MFICNYLIFRVIKRKLFVFSVRRTRRFRSAPVLSRRRGPPSVHRGPERLLRPVRRQGARGHIQFRLPGRAIGRVVTEHGLGRTATVAHATCGHGPRRKILLVHVFLVGHHGGRGCLRTPATAAAVGRPPTTAPPLFRPVAERFVRRLGLIAFRKASSSGNFYRTNVTRASDQYYSLFSDLISC